MKKLLLVACIAFVNIAAAQDGADNPAYIKAVEAAFSELKKSKCEPCLAAYRKAFEISKHSSLSHLRAAFCAQMCGLDSEARVLAEKAIAISWKDADQVWVKASTYPELDQLRRSLLGQEIGEKIKIAAMASGYNHALAQELELLREQDQRPRVEVDVVRSKYGHDSPEMKKFTQDWLHNDSLCLQKAEAIIAQYGYPGKTMVGEARQDVIWLVIQHAPIEKQEQYFPLIEAAAQKGEMSKSSWAYLLDRIRMRRGKPQLYGSQVVRDELTGGWKFHEIEDEANVNQRRAEVGLGPLEDYAAQMGVNWKPK